MAVAGVLTRIRPDERERIESTLAGYPGVSTFRIGDEEERIGILLEGPSLERIHAFVTGELAAVDGVLGAWPVYGHAEPDDATAIGEGSVIFEAKSEA